MPFFLCKLVPPRPTFPQDMTPAERAVMQEHLVYWTGLADQGTAVVFGPVADPNGVWGVSIVEVEDEAAVRKLTTEDPTMRAALGFQVEIYPMPTAILGKAARSP